MADKKQKAKILKSVHRTDVLTLICEWDDCFMIYDEMSLFISHLTEHLDQVQSSNGPKTEDAVEGGEFFCLWRDCGHHEVVSSTFSELTQNTFFHAFHVKLKCVGVSLMLKNSLSRCSSSSSSSRRSMIPDLPDQFVCGWQYCGVTYDNPELYYAHVSYHCDAYPIGNFPPGGGCRCYWDVGSLLLICVVTWRRTSVYIVDGCTYHAHYFWEMSLHTKNVHQPAKIYATSAAKDSTEKKTNQFKWPSRHTRFRYKQHGDGYYRLLTVRYESLLNVKSGLKSDDSIKITSGRMTVDS